MSDTQGVAETNDPIPPSSDSGPCGAWATVDDMPEGCPCITEGSGGDTPDEAQLDELLQQATDVMWALLAYPVFGPCERTVYPCRTGYGSAPSVENRRRSLLYGACECCGCDSVWLEGPIYDVVQVIINGDVLPRTEYELHDGFRLVRPHGSWPAGGGAVSEQKFVITYEMGTPVPPLVRDSVVELANDLWLSRCGARDGRLSRAVSSVSTQGVSMGFQRDTVAGAARDAGEQLPKVWQAVSTYNPSGVRLRPFFYSPDAPYTNRVIRTFS